MERRTFVSGAAALIAGSLAGCLSSGPADGDDEPTDTPTPSPTPSPTLSVTDETFTVEDVSSGTGENEASVTFGDAVVVDGTIRGNNGCYTASLGSVSVADGTLTVVVESREKPGSGACTQALVDVDYRAEVSFEGALPGRVVVEHDVDGETTTVADEQR